MLLQLECCEGIMGILSLSDIVITTTLFLNAVALLSSKIPNVESQFSDNSRSDEVPLNDVESEGVKNEATELESVQTSTVSRCYHFLHIIRQFSCIIVMWNVFFLILMTCVFRD